MRHRVRLMACDFSEACQGFLISSSHGNSHLLLGAINRAGHCTVRALAQCSMKDFWILLLYLRVHKASYCSDHMVYSTDCGHWCLVYKLHWWSVHIKLCSASFFTQILGLITQYFMLSHCGAVVMKQHEKTANGHLNIWSAYLVNCSVNFHWNDKISIVHWLLRA